MHPVNEEPGAGLKPAQEAVRSYFVDVSPTIASNRLSAIAPSRVRASRRVKRGGPWRLSCPAIGAGTADSGYVG
jgi:hypothetical protein